MIRTTIALACDRRNTEECWSLDPYRVPIVAGKADRVRARAKEYGWHRTADGEDVCPECWSRRVRYRAGRPVSRD